MPALRSLASFKAIKGPPVLKVEVGKDTIHILGVTSHEQAIAYVENYLRGRSANVVAAETEHPPLAALFY
jgi:hypothetical protein